jgi:hypothetical protein
LHPSPVHEQLSVRRIGEDVVDHLIGWSPPDDLARVQTGLLETRNPELVGEEVPLHAARGLEQGELLEERLQSCGQRLTAVSEQ